MQFLQPTTSSSPRSPSTAGSSRSLCVISGRERQQLVEKWQSVKDDEAAQQDLLPFVCALTLVDEDGARPFDPTEAGDLDLLKSKGARQLEAIYHAAMRLNGMEDDAIDEAVANFQETPN